jgi:hypothetical protein
VTRRRKADQGEVALVGAPPEVSLPAAVAEVATPPVVMPRRGGPPWAVDVVLAVAVEMDGNRYPAGTRLTVSPARRDRLVGMGAVRANRH